MITALFFVLVFLVLALQFYLLWTLHERVEKLTNRLSLLSTKVNEGEDVVIENFSLIEKRFAKIDHEIKDFKQIETKAKEAFRTATRLNRDLPGHS